MTATPLSPTEVDTLRAATPGTANVNHLNHAGSSLPSQATLDRHIRHLQREAEIGGYEAGDEAIADDDHVYDAVAQLINAQPTEIARVDHATTAWNAGFWSVPMQKGQRILTANAAYGANAVGFLRARDREGVVVDVVPNDEHGQVDVAEMANRMGDDVALVAITHIPTNGGLINPAAAVGALANEAGVPFLLDACQSVGHIDIDVQAIGCDLLSATGRKYLRGPRGTGFLYASDRIIDQLDVDHPDHHGADWYEPDNYRLLPGAKRFEYWEYAHASWIALGTAVDEAIAIGTDRIEATVIERGAQLRERLTSHGHQVFDLGAERGGIVTMNVAGHAAPAVKEHLGARGINVSVTAPNGTLWDFAERSLDSMVRISVHYLTTEDELDQAVTAINEL